MFEDIPNWGWALLVAQGITMYWVDRVGKAGDHNYMRIMKQLRPDAFREEDKS